MRSSDSSKITASGTSSLPDERRINSTTSISSQTTNTYVYDKRGNVIQSTDAAGVSTWSYYDDLNRKIAEINPPPPRKKK